MWHQHRGNKMENRQLLKSLLESHHLKMWSNFMAVCRRWARWEKSVIEGEVIDGSNGNGAGWEVRGGRWTNSDSISSFGTPSNRCSESQSEPKRSGKRGDQGTLHAFPVEMQWKREVVKGQEEDNLLSHPSIHPYVHIKTSQCSNREATKRKSCNSGFT